MQELLDENSA